MARHRPYLVPLYFCVVLLVSFFTYFRGYATPRAVFWDENYHIASAYKYLNGVFFMEPHPPLGKLLIAAGEYIFHPNETLNTSEFIKTDYVKEFPSGFSFAGVRFFPALFAWLSALAFFLLLLEVTRNPHVALIFSSLFVFDNALVVHSRGAMLESPQIFWVVLSLWHFARLVNRKLLSSQSILPWYEFGILGILVSLAVAIKVNALILILLPLGLIALDSFLNHSFNRNQIFGAIKHLLAFLSPLALVTALIWYLHFVIASTPVENRTYRASEEYKSIMQVGDTAKLANFWLLFSEHYEYFRHYERGAPKLDVCKSDENGSFPLAWLVGKKSINYRWEKTKDGEAVRYLYLQANPVAWLIGLTGVVLSIVLILGHLVFGLSIKDKRLFYLITIFSLLYLAYMTTMLRIDRVMYLYHYFIPLIISFTLAALLFMYLFEVELQVDDAVVYSSAGILVLCVVLCFIFYSPLTYYEGLNSAEFYRRVWFEFWQLKPIN